MAKNSCPICKIINIRAEMQKHPNVQTIMNFGRCVDRPWTSKEQKALSECAEHRPVPLNADKLKEINASVQRTYDSIVVAVKNASKDQELFKACKVR